jgi:uncharacterized membrane protein YbhN (UPF0104 family)
MTPDRRPNRLLRVGIFIFWAFGIALILLLAWRFRDEIIPFLASVSPWGLFKAFGWFLLSLIAIVGGWVALMRHFAPGVPWWTHVRIYCVTLATRRLPGTLWYVGGRLVLYKRAGISRALVSIASSVEYAVIIVSGALVGLVLLPTAVDFPGGPAVPLALAAVMVIFSPRLVAWLANRIGRPLPVAIGFIDVLGWLAALSVMWLCGGMMLVEIIRAFSPLAGEQTVFVLGAWALTGTLGALTFALPSSFGIGDISLAFLLAQIMPLAEAATVAVVTRFLGLLFEVAVAVIFLPWVRREAPE